MNAEFLILVDKVKTVAIPDIGAVVKMGKKYSFNHFLKFNDGRFSKHFQETGISKQEADQKVVEWVSSIKDRLQTNGSYVFEGMGVLYLEGDGKYRWEQEALVDENPSGKTISQDTEVTGEIETPVNVIEEEPSLTVVLPQYESGYLSTHFDVTRAKDEIKRIHNMDELTEFTKNDKRSTVIAVVEKQKKKILDHTVKENEGLDEQIAEKEILDNEVKEQVKNESKILETIKEKEAEEKDNNNDEVNDKPEQPSKFKLDAVNEEDSKEHKEVTADENIAKSKEQVQDQAKSPAKKKRKLFLIAMLLIITGTVIIGVLKYDQLKQYFLEEVKNKKEKTVEKLENVKADIIEENNIDNVDETITDTEGIVDEAVVENEDLVNGISSDNDSDTEPDITNEPIKINSSDGPFHIIVGAFTLESNANNFLDTKLKEGFTNSSVFNGPKNKYYVQIGDYSSKDEALKVLSEYDIDAWVLNYE